MNCSRTIELEQLAAALVDGARLELYLTPKPGLVDRKDCGSHPDLSLAIMERSIDIVADYLVASVRSLIRDEPFAEQKALGIEAEQRLYNELKTNTHKGYIFLSGMLLNACWRAPSSNPAVLRRTLSALSRAFFDHSGETSSHGQEARKNYDAGGIVRESIAGFPSLFDIALPAFRMTYQQSADFELASFSALARLMQSVDDTTTLHRAGPAGLLRVKRDGRELERHLAANTNPVDFLGALNRDYVDLNITMGGVADMLGLTYAVLIANQELPKLLHKETARANAK